jgi:uncharacterized DUF497 family protein
MNRIVFEWDNKKAKDNLRKHGVTFAEAQSVFFYDVGAASSRGKTRCL